MNIQNALKLRKNFHTLFLHSTGCVELLWGAKVNRQLNTFYFQMGKKEHQIKLNAVAGQLFTSLFMSISHAQFENNFS